MRFSISNALSSSVKSRYLLLSNIYCKSLLFIYIVISLSLCSSADRNPYVPVGLARSLYSFLSKSAPKPPPSVALPVPVRKGQNYRR